MNITFDPQPIRITLADLPPPYATSSVINYGNIIDVPLDPRLFVPKGFSVKLYMSGLISPRYLQYTPAGDILVSESAANRISCLLDTDKDGYPDRRVTIADQTNGLTYPFGMAFVNGYLYSGNQHNIRRYKWVDCSQPISGTGEIVLSYPGVRHVTRTILVPPMQDRMYVSIGSASNVDADPLPLASIQVANLDGTNQRTFASGLRNSVGLAFHPITSDLYASCQERDEIGDDLVPEFFTRVQENDFFGWPYAYLSPELVDPRRRLENGSSERPDLVARTRTPDVLIKSHSSVLDTAFYTGKEFPEHYRNGAFIALRNSGNRKVATGSKIIFIPFDHATNRPMGYYEDFVYGFLTNATSPEKFGTPVGLLVLKDGSMIFTEDANHRIYQVQYIGEKSFAVCFVSRIHWMVLSYLIVVSLSELKYLD